MEIIWRQDSMVDIEWKVIQSTCYLYSDYYCVKCYKVDAVRKEIADALKLSFVLYQPLSSIFNLFPFFFDLNLFAWFFDL